MPEAIFRAAAEEGNVQAVTAWLDDGGDVDGRCAECEIMTLLMVAAATGHEVMVQMLLQRRASVNLQDSSGCTALIAAALKGEEAIVRMLLQRGARVNFQGYDGSTALMYAANQGHTTIVQALLDAKANASLQDNNGGTALMFAEYYKHTATAQLLREHAKREAPEAEAKATASLAAAADDGMAPNATMNLLSAACLGDAQAVAAWLDEGGNVDARCAERDDVTLLFAAAAAGQEAMVRMLLQCGASVDLQASGGVTALMAAASNDHTAIVQVLLDAKADASLQDFSGGGTALMVAELHKRTATAQLLQQHAKRTTVEAEAGVVMHTAAAAPTPNLSCRRVRIVGLKGRPELNGRSGVAGRFDAAKGRYEVAVEGEAEAVLLKPANLQECRANPNPNPIPKPHLILALIYPGQGRGRGGGASCGGGGGGGQGGGGGCGLGAPPSRARTRTLTRTLTLNPSPNPRPHPEPEPRTLTRTLSLTPDP